LVIGDRTVLTAAHCVKSGYTLVALRAGAHNYTEDENVDARIQTRTTGQLVQHEKYNETDATSIQYDLGLIVVDQSLQFNGTFFNFYSLKWL
jgi:V8-like Glu-specific endopeptidase